MKTLESDLCIVGGGAVGLVLATFQVSRFPNKKIIVFSGDRCNLSASAAAGAMINVASEVDYVNYASPLTKLKLTNYNNLFQSWKDIETLLSPYLPGGKLLYGSGTEIRLNNSSSNNVEISSFRHMHSTAKKHNIPVTDINEGPSFTSFNLPYEQSVDSLLFIKALRAYLLSNEVKILDEDVRSITESHEHVELCSSSFRIKAAFTCVAAGVYSDKIIRLLDADLSKLVPCYCGVGSAVLLSSESDYVPDPIISNIVRTPNRGGTCGIHVVQRKHNLYVGASSMTTANFPLRPRAESIEILLRGYSATLQRSISGLSMSTITGYRPTSIDTYPIVGQISKHIYSIYGTKRDGLTWSPLFGKAFASYTANDSSSSEFVTQLAMNYSPFRRPISFGSHEHASLSYVESKTAESMQHGILLSESDTSALYQVAKNLHKQLPLEFSIHPELVNIFAFNKSQFQNLKSLL